jgi:hypothetical protein
MNTQIDPHKIAKLLTKSTQQMGERTVSALAHARKQALTRQTAHAPIFALTTGHWVDRLLPHTTVQWLVTGLLIALLIVSGGAVWQHAEEQQISEIDLAILSDEMPVHVFVN